MPIGRAIVKEFGKKQWPILNYYPKICLEGLQKTTKSLSQYYQPPGRVSNTRSPKYKAEFLTSQRRCSVRRRRRKRKKRTEEENGGTLHKGYEKSVKIQKCNNVLSSSYYYFPSNYHSLFGSQRDNS